MVRLLVNLVVVALLTVSFVAIYKSTIFAFDHLKDVKDSKEVSPCICQQVRPVFHIQGKGSGWPNTVIGKGKGGVGVGLQQCTCVDRVRRTN